MGDVGGGRLELDARPDERAGPFESPTTETSQAQPQTPTHTRSPSPPRPRTSRLQFWRSPDDQPRWARPALLAVATLAALAYAWGINGDALETFYAGAVRSMSESWRNFFFGAFDPWGTVSVDKLPGAFWVQALSVRVFGFHVWAIEKRSPLEHWVSATTELLAGSGFRDIAHRIVRFRSGNGLVMRAEKPRSCNQNAP